MGIGLVDPILASLRDKLHATPSQVELLFTSYLVVTAVAMLVTGWVSSRIGAKRTLITGLVLIVVFAALAGSSDSIAGIVGFRAGWGLGNALFIATSLAVIVSSASGGFAGAIILYETALGVGIAMGPLLGGELGSISWRGPFYGVSALMAIALVATLVLLPKTPPPARREKLSEPIKALKHRALATTSGVGLLYNWGFFTLLGYSPFLMQPITRSKLGLVFCGWGVLVAVFAVWGAPWLKAAVRHRTHPVRQLRADGRRPRRHRHLARLEDDRHRRRHRRRRLHRREQHAGHHRGHEHRPGRASGRVRDLRLRPVHRRRSRAVRGRASSSSTTTRTSRS